MKKLIVSVGNGSKKRVHEDFPSHDQSFRRGHLFMLENYVVTNSEPPMDGLNHFGRDTVLVPG